MKVVILVEDGLIQDVICDSKEPIEYLLVDYTSLASQEDLVVLDGGEAYAYISDAILSDEITEKFFKDFNDQCIDG